MNYEDSSLLGCCSRRHPFSRRHENLKSHRNLNCHMGCEILEAVKLVMVFLVVMPYESVGGYQRFGEHTASYLNKCILWSLACIETQLAGPAELRNSRFNSRMWSKQ